MKVSHNENIMINSFKEIIHYLNVMTNTNDLSFIRND